MVHLATTLVPLATLLVHLTTLLGYMATLKSPLLSIWDHSLFANLGILGGYIISFSKQHPNLIGGQGFIGDKIITLWVFFSWGQDS